MVAGLIHDIPTCKQLIDRILAQADAIIPTADGLCLGLRPVFSAAGQ